jgi:hypothetical protein
MCAKLCVIVILCFCFFPDTFQALIQYPDVVTAQAAKLVSSDNSDAGFRKCVL